MVDPHSKLQQNNGLDQQINSLISQSPEELALIDFARQTGYSLIQKENDFIQLKNTQGVFESYEILLEVPFSSTTRKQSMLLLHR